MEDEQGKADHWFDRLVVPFLTRWMQLFEFVIVFAIVIVIAGSIIFEARWVICGVPAPLLSTPVTNAQDRFQKLIGSINANWKIGLIILIPLFYRTTRAFVERMEEGPFGTRAPKSRQPITTDKGLIVAEPKEEVQ